MKVKIKYNQNANGLTRVIENVHFISEDEENETITLGRLLENNIVVSKYQFDKIEIERK